MKKLFTIIAVASMMLTTVGFTSCQKDELPAPQQTNVNNNSNSNATPIISGNTTTVEEQNAKQQMNYFGYKLFVNDELLALGDIVVTANYDGKTVEYKASEGQTASLDMSKYFTAKEKMEGKTTVFSGKQITVPTFQAGSHKASFTWKFVSNESAFSALDMNGRTNVLVAWGGMANYDNNISIDVANPNSIDGIMGNTCYTGGDKVFSLGLDNTKILDLLNKKANLSAVNF